MLSFFINNINRIILVIYFNAVNNFFVLPFETIYVKDQSIDNNTYYNILFQNELYVNLSIGNPPQNTKSLLKMEISGFEIYQGAFNYNLSSTSEKGIWDLNVNRLWHFMSYPIKDYFYFISFNSYDNFINCYIKDNKLNYELLNIAKTNKISFLVMYNPPEYSNKNYYYYDIIGLKFNEQYYLDPISTPQFIFF